MRPFSIALALGVLASVAVAGCATDGSTGLLTTQSVPTKPAPRKVSAADAACIALREKISALRAEGTVERVEKAGQGKTATVKIKRASLQKVAELNQANAEFQAKCSRVPLQARSSACYTHRTAEARCPSASSACVECNSRRT